MKRQMGLVNLVSLSIVSSVQLQILKNVDSLFVQL